MAFDQKFIAVRTLIDLAERIHNDLQSRDGSDCHPESAITSLSGDLSSKVDKSGNITQIITRNHNDLQNRSSSDCHPETAITGLSSDITNLRIGAIEMIIDGGGTAITTGQKGFLEIPFACTINRNTVLADQSGSIVIDIWKVPYTNFPPSVSNSICSSTLPTLSGAQNSQDNTLTGWTTTIDAGDILAFNVNSVATVTRVTLSLKVTKS